MRKKMLMELKPLKVMNRHIADANLYIHYTLIKRTMFLKGMITRQRNGQKVCWIRPFFQNGYIRKILI